jgi:hypothetical protein
VIYQSLFLFLLLFFFFAGIWEGFSDEQTSLLSLQNLRKENVNLATRLSQVVQTKVPELQCQFSFPLHSSFVKPN